MANLTRYKQKIFAGNSNQIGVFGTGVNKQTSTNVETLQSAAYASGWSSAIVTNKNYPIWQERDGVDYGFSYQLAYLLQKGIPDWLATETYYTNDYCKYGSDLYYSLQDNNVGQNPAGTTGYWQLVKGADRDLSNLTTTGKTNLVQLANVLDYANAIQISVTSSGAEQNYTCLDDGVIYLNARVYGGAALKYCYTQFIITIINTDMEYGTYYSGTDTLFETSEMLAYKNGDIARFLCYASGGSNTNKYQAYFIPFKK